MVCTKLWSPLSGSYELQIKNFLTLTASTTISFTACRAWRRFMRHSCTRRSVQRFRMPSFGAGTRHMCQSSPLVTRSIQKLLMQRFLRMLSTTKFYGVFQTIYYNQKKLADQAMQEFYHYKEKPSNFATEENWRDDEETRSLEMVPRIL